MKNLTRLLAGATFGALTLACVSAAPEPYYSKKQVIEECTVPFTGSTSFGYESDYIFRGVNNGSNAFWGSAAANFALNNGMSIDIGTWYINPTNQPDFNGRDPFNVGDELDIYAFLNFALPRGINASWGFTAYTFPEINSVAVGSGADTWETSLGVSQDFGFAELGTFIAYDFDVNDGWYYEFRAMRTIALADCLDLNLGSGLACSDAGVIGVNDWEHTYVRAGLGWHMTESAVFNLYGGYNFLLDGYENALGNLQDDESHWGASVTVSF